MNVEPGLHARPQNLTTVLMMTQVFWDVKQHLLVHSRQRLGRARCLHFKGLSSHSSSAA